MGKRHPEVGIPREMILAVQVADRNAVGELLSKNPPLGKIRIAFLNSMSCS